MDNETTTMPAVLTPPGTPTTAPESEPINPVYLGAFVLSLLLVAALVYFV